MINLTKEYNIHDVYIYNPRNIENKFTQKIQDKINTDKYNNSVLKSKFNYDDKELFLVIEV